MWGVNFPEMLVILVIVLLIFGAGKLPKVGRQIGAAISELRTGLKGEDEKKTENTEPKNGKAE